MKGWEINALRFAEEHDKGTCPKCGSSNIEVQEFRNGRRHSITFRCLDCGSGDHLDGFLSEEE